MFSKYRVRIIQGMINIKRGVIITSLIDSPSYRPPPQGVKCSKYPRCQFISSLSENDKQYETKRAWIFLQSRLVGNKGVLKGGGGGGVQLLLPPYIYLPGIQSGPEALLTSILSRSLKTPNSVMFKLFIEG